MGKLERIVWPNKPATSHLADCEPVSRTQACQSIWLRTPAIQPIRSSQSPVGVVVLALVALPSLCYPSGLYNELGCS